MARSRKLTFVVWLATLVFAVFLLAQFKQPDRSNPPVVSSIEAPAEVSAILERACYNCHSNQTVWPWYSYVAPVSWWVADHVQHGRGDLNFSEWPSLDFEAIEHSMGDIVEEIEEDEMPLKSYRLIHPEARLTDEEKATLLGWAKAGR